MPGYHRKRIDISKSPYSKFNGSPNRLYGERSYKDKLKIESSSLPRENKVDYEMDFKQYRPQKQENKTQVEWNAEDKVEPRIEDKIQSDLNSIQLEILSYLKQNKNKLETVESEPVKIEASSGSDSKY